jgi:hypothetical protein
MYLILILNILWKSLGWEGVGWTDQALDREKVAGSCERGHEPSISIKCGNIFY